MELYLTAVRRLPEAQQFELTWNDGHSARLDFDYVRGFCPCAACQGHGAFAVERHPPRAPVVPEHVTAVGNYGIAIGWSDRHATGIYRFDFLREICSCAACGGPKDRIENS